MFNVNVDIIPFEQVCYLIYQRVKKLKKIPFDSLCDAISDLATSHSMDTDTEYRFCIPDQVGMGHLVYPHESFLDPEPAKNSEEEPTSRLFTISFWRSIIRKYRNTEITDPAVVGFADEISVTLGIAA